MDVVEALREAGHDALHLRERGWHGMPDGEVLAEAVADHRILLTHDLDMGQLLALAGGIAPSLITFRLTDMRPTSVTPRLFDALGEFGQELAVGAAVTIADRAARCHRLPLRRPGA